MHGYYLCPDSKLLQNLLEGLKENEERYGYPSCPCRISSGIFEIDRDIICPCDYRDSDILDYGACYCSLYVDKTTYEKGNVGSIPERRHEENILASLGSTSGIKNSETRLTLFYCKQCGYTVYRNEPPLICPICRAKKEFFSKIPLKHD